MEGDISEREYRKLRRDAVREEELKAIEQRRIIEDKRAMEERRLNDERNATKIREESFRTIDEFVGSVDFSYEFLELDKKLKLLAENSDDAMHETGTPITRREKQTTFTTDRMTECSTEKREICVGDRHTESPASEQARDAFGIDTSPMKESDTGARPKVKGEGGTSLELIETVIQERKQLDTEMELEREYIRQLREETEKLEHAKRKRDDEERLLAERIRELKIAKDELDDFRNERRRLEEELMKRKEYEKLRDKKIEFMTQKEQELSKGMTTRTQNDTLNFQTPQVGSYGVPRVPPFSGSDYKTWRIEVDYIMNCGLYPEILISQALRSSLKADTRRILLTLHPMATSYDILTKLEDIYGTPQTEDSMMQELFNAKQVDGETSADWALRIESIVQAAVEAGEIQERKRNSLLKQRFWKGLRSDVLRSNTRVTFESQATFEHLRKKARLEEFEILRLSPNVIRPNWTSKDLRKDIDVLKERPISNDPQQVNVRQSNDSQKQTDILQTLLARMERMEKEIADLKKERKDSGSKEKSGFNKDFNKTWRKKDGDGKDLNQ